MDRVAQPWGDPTPHRPGDPWPVRFDRFPAPGTAADGVERWSQGASLPHSDGDAMDIAVADGRIVGVRGRAGDRVNRGRPGPKDLFGRQANHAADRLTTPPVRREHRLEACDRDTA
ncbi:hypothetical protein KSNIM_01030 [Kitasatospora sp. DSM 101779]|nr:hypothetical protein [Kitasatospora sp. DSM 101779]MCU7820278.1 hypothetical protein [Kitasatospora sp. DSM 101779]